MIDLRHIYYHKITGEVPAAQLMVIDDQDRRLRARFIGPDAITYADLLFQALCRLAPRAWVQYSSHQSERIDLAETFVEAVTA